LHGPERGFGGQKAMGVSVCERDRQRDRGKVLEKEVESRHYRNHRRIPTILLSLFVSELTIDLRWCSTRKEYGRQLENSLLLLTTNIWGLRYLCDNENLPGKNSDTQIFV
jgi:hypothetical protein